MTKSPLPTEIPKSNVTTQNATKNFDYTTIADGLRTVSWSYNSRPTGMVKRVLWAQTFQLTASEV